MKKLVVCGDSFNCGLGCEDLFTEPYGVLLAKKLNMELITLARGGASNFSIHLQAEYAVQHIEHDLLIISTTSYDRIEWLSENSRNIHRPTAANINYHQYPPHNGNYQGKPPPDFYFKNKPEYNPGLLTEQIGGIDYYVTRRNKEGATDYFKKLHSEPISKLQLMIDYNVQVMNDHIKEQYDMGVIFKAYTKAKRKNIQCLVLTDNPELIELVDPNDLHKMNWFGLGAQYPDRIGSGHCTPEAHAIVANDIFNKLQGIQND